MRGLQLAPQNLRLNHVAHFNSERKKIPVQVVSTLSPKSHHLEHSEPRNSKTCQDGNERDAVPSPVPDAVAHNGSSPYALSIARTIDTARQIGVIVDHASQN